MLDHGIESAVGMIRGTAQRQPGRALVRHPLGEHAYQAGFANAGLAAEQHHLAQPVATLRPALPQQPHLVLPTYQGRQPGGPGHVEATLGGAFFHHAVHAQRRLDPLQTGTAEVVAAKIPLHQPVRCLTDRHRIGHSEALQPGREVRCLAQGQLLVAAAAPHGAHDHRPRMDADPHGEPHALARSRRVFNDPMASRMPRPVRTARCASSSWACG